MGTRILFLAVGIGVLLVQRDVQACMEGLQACFKYFESRSGTPTGICDLAADQLDCLGMVRLTCSSTAPVEGAFQGFKAEYEGAPNNCIFDNIAQSPDYPAFQCTKLFEDCKSKATTTTCGLVDFYEICTNGLSTFCSVQNLQNATSFINAEKQRLASEQGCYFATTPRVLLSGAACFSQYVACYEADGVIATTHPCVAVPVYERCQEATVTGVCDAAASQMAISHIGSKQLECDAATTTTTISTTTSVTTSATPIPTQTVATQHLAASMASQTAVSTDHSSTQGITKDMQGHIYLDFKDCGTHLCLHAMLAVSCVMVHVVLRW
ncbi:uncharacterized protein LOC124123824 isoform X1 [Haliotis rufescens]|uniref:uncharacterized protein LOC124123824 isoform X1 n=1 Tax=Haliotis rufescens TaxID=6454 RepID=UPI001EAFA31A|nr:uncharacterized protein LOC124123824 isoform X1 [Haliotis rufescens]